MQVFGRRRVHSKAAAKHQVLVVFYLLILLSLFVHFYYLIIKLFAQMHDSNGRELSVTHSQQIHIHCFPACGSSPRKRKSLAAKRLPNARAYFDKKMAKDILMHRLTNSNETLEMTKSRLKCLKCNILFVNV